MGNTPSDQRQQHGAKVSSVYTRALRNGREIDVGELTVQGVTDPGSVWKVDFAGDPYVFLSHRGQDAKDEIIRPTNWFLSEILKVRTFFDAETMPPGDEKTRSLIEPAHECTHAVVFVSPSFRESKYCVMELNTFVSRHRRGGVSLIPCLWHINDVYGLQGYAPVLKQVTWLKPGTWDAPSYLVSKLWPVLMQKLERRTQTPLKTLLLQYVQENRRDDTTPPIPQSLEKWFHENSLRDFAHSSMRLGQVFEENPSQNTAEAPGDRSSVASIFSSCSTLTNESNASNSALSFKHVPIKAFGRSSDDKSYLEDYYQDAEWKYNWKQSPDGIGRDEANAFYYNAYVAYYKVQRVVVVDKKAKQIMICTPMNWAAYYIMRELREDSNMNVNRAYERGLLGATGGELDEAFRYMHYRRCEKARNIVYSREERTLSVLMVNNRTVEQQWVIEGFPGNGGWGKFLNSMLAVKIRWVAVVQGETGVRNNDDGCWTLVFRDEEAELLMGEPRTFGTCKGLQFRGGAFGTFFQNGAKDQLVIPEDRIIFKGHSGRRPLREVGEKLWKLDVESACDDLEGFEL